MVVGVLFFISGISVAIFMRKKQRWLKWHRGLAMTGSGFILLGFVMAILMVSFAGKSHFAVPHAYLGIFTVFFAALTPLLGILQFRVKAKARIRAIHRWSGRSLFFLAILTGIAGLFQAGIL
jgi:uncharacterized membrane protein YidH (DUF202 family)